MTKEYWITNSRFKLIVIVLIILWLGLMLLFYLKADEVTKDPCSVCANKLGEKVTCSAQSGMKIINKIFYPNFSIAGTGG